MDSRRFSGKVNCMSERITVNTDICNGKPVIRGTRITVQTVQEFLGAGDSVQEEFLQLTTERHDLLWFFGLTFPHDDAVLTRASPTCAMGVRGICRGRRCLGLQLP